ncbi:hypothetical protein D9758_002423 [Tetrapyrgos nigripes]|uniref:TPR-like protein n=1 Tax=Tetrapyrgos nigripes TaxID=182062 RepID=A0A8H5GNM8_9AGAR|nr:hypothetical protein D9758_002423 [Tetrapyrgos nigripes]
MESDHNCQSEPSQSADDSVTSLEKSLEYADELKNEGNDHFRAKRWEEALAAYRSGVGNLPKRKSTRSSQKSSSREDDPDSAEKDDAGPSSSSSSQDAERPSQEAKQDSEPQEEDSEDPELIKIRAVLNANIAACYVKLNDHKAAVEACTEALHDDPHYIKALQRRAASNNKLDTWSSLTSAQEGHSTTTPPVYLDSTSHTDYNALLKLVVPSSSEAAEIQRSLRNLKPRIEAAQKKETGEMLGKLKGLGNSILGNFGLSTDNFQFVPNGQGGYSVNFSK